MLKNQLHLEKSPYLLQHAHNPVAWQAWNKNSLRLAADLDRPIFLSIGYATCHWCHVMERESFMSQEVADVINTSFIPIKVDREERPDIDQIYMGLAQSLGFGGGWPLNLFLTPSEYPITGGTYFPPVSRYGNPSFLEVLKRVAMHWRDSRSDIEKWQAQLQNALQKKSTNHLATHDVHWIDLIALALNTKDELYQGELGGFSPAPKFPMGHLLSFLLEASDICTYTSMPPKVIHTLTKMASGGICDQVGGGFHRYSTDDNYLVPHFEKMLYDQALLIPAYLSAAHQIAKTNVVKDRVAQSAEWLMYMTAARTILYVKEMLRSPMGGFYSAEDADSEGEEGLYYTWTESEMSDLKLDGQMKDYFCLPASPQFEGRYIFQSPESFLHWAQKNEMSEADAWQKIFSELNKIKVLRNNRVHPFRDEKIMPDWNGLMISALCHAARCLPKGFPISPEQCVVMAQGAADFILQQCSLPNGRLSKMYLDGIATSGGCLDDYAFMANALLDLYQITLNPIYMEKCLEMSVILQKYFWCPESSAFAVYPSDGAKLVGEGVEFYDGAIPSGNSAAIYLMIRLSCLGRVDCEEYIQLYWNQNASMFQKNPTAYTSSLLAYSWKHTPVHQIVMSGDAHSAEFKKWHTKALLANSSQHIIIHSRELELLNGNTIVTEQNEQRSKIVSAHICVGHVCGPVRHNFSDFEKDLSELN